jgi:hypothetical protein
MKKAAVLAGLCLLLPAAPLPAAGDDLNTELMKATFKLANNTSTATAFLLSRTATRDGGPFLLVTAGHVFEKMTGDEATLFFRRRESPGVYKKVPMKLAVRKAGKPLWTRHPTADVAVMEVSPPEGCVVPRLPLDLLATDDVLKKCAIHPGDNLRLLGYPHRVEANEAGFPVLRGGLIASYPLVPTRLTKTFLLSLNTFEGDSGGPVYLAEPARRDTGKGPARQARLILGLVVGQHFLNEEARLIYGTTVIRHRLGLAIVVHASFIKETVDRLPAP